MRVAMAIDGMSCSACSTRLEKAFDNAEGIVEAHVNLPLETATVDFDPSIVDVNSLVEVVQKTGFDVGTETKSFGLEGMTCSACVNRAESALASTSGVLEANVNLGMESASITYIKHLINYEQLAKVIQNVGFSLVDKSSPTAAQAEQSKPADTYRLILSCVIAVPFVIQMVAQWFGWDDIHLMPAAEVSLASIVICLVGPRFFHSARSALMNRSANMDVLVSLGSLAAYFFSWFLMIKLGEASEGELYFEAAVLILTLVMLGKHFESRAKRATKSAVRSLLNIRPTTVRVVIGNEEPVERPISQLKVDDLYQCFPGQIVAADGLIVEGVAHLDEALVTGESTPVGRGPQEHVIEGSVNLDGQLIVKTTAVGSESTLQKIIAMIENAQIGKTGVQRLVDQVSGVFVPIVVCIAIGVMLMWLFLTGDYEAAIINGVTVLVIACPCALGLATPTAVMTGVGVAAKHGILFKDLNVLEAARSIDTFLLDKTGTVTEEAPTLSHVSPLGQLDATTCLQIAASIQAKSAHPIARAFQAKAEEDGLPLLEVTEFKSTIGQGVQGRLGSTEYFLGSQRFLASQEIKLDPTQVAERTIFLGSKDQALASFVVDEQIRPDSVGALRDLSDAGMDLMLVSGDSRNRVERLANRLAIQQSRAELLPEDKVAMVAELEASGKHVAVVGDGINDAPALAAASVGIALRSQTNVAMEVAPVTLMRSDLRLLKAMVDVSQVTFRKIKQNLFWAFIYNIVMLPLAALGLLSPTIAGAAMAMSSISVVLNSLWLRKWRPLHRSSGLA